MEFFYKNKDEFMKYEIEAAERIKKKYDKKVIKTCNNYKYDFKTDDLIKYEVKAEPTSLKTNNFFIEYFGYGKPSGISISKSNYYIITDTINYYLIDTLTLKEIIERNTFKTVKTRDKMTFGYLVNKNIIIGKSICI